MSDTVTVRLTEDGPVRMRGGGQTWERGETREVSQERAEELTATHDFVDIVDGEVSTGGETESETSSESSPDDAGGADDFDIDSWLDEDYDDRADQVRAGEVDDHLGVIDEHETSDNVRDAIGERRAELEA